MAVPSRHARLPWVPPQPFATTPPLGRSARRRPPSYIPPRGTGETAGERERDLQSALEARSLSLGLSLAAARRPPSLLSSAPLPPSFPSSLPPSLLSSWVSRGPSTSKTSRTGPKLRVVVARRRRRPSGPRGRRRLGRRRGEGRGTFETLVGRAPRPPRGPSGPSRAPAREAAASRSAASVVAASGRGGAPRRPPRAPGGRGRGPVTGRSQSRSHPRRRRAGRRPTAPRRRRWVSPRVSAALARGRPGGA